jgi:hypothetical protein
MIANDFAPIWGIKLFAIMRNLAVTLISAIFEEPGSRRRSIAPRLPWPCPSCVTSFHSAHHRGSQPAENKGVDVDGGGVELGDPDDRQPDGERHHQAPEPQARTEDPVHGP